MSRCENHFVISRALSFEESPFLAGPSPGFKLKSLVLNYHGPGDNTVFYNYEDVRRPDNLFKGTDVGKASINSRRDISVLMEPV